MGEESTLGLAWSYKEMAQMQWEIQHELPVNVDILLLIGLPPEPFAFHVRVGVVFVKPG